MITTYYPGIDAFWTNVCGIYRHSRCSSREHHGLYEVIVKDTNTLDFFCDRDQYGIPAWTHRYAVVDDYGNLVRVI